MRGRRTNNGVVITMTLAVSSVEHLQLVIQRLKEVEGVDSVQRATI